MYFSSYDNIVSISNLSLKNTDIQVSQEIQQENIALNDNQKSVIEYSILIIGFFLIGILVVVGILDILNEKKRKINKKL